MADAKKDWTTEIQVLVTVYINRTSGELQERIGDGGGTTSEADLVCNEIESNLASVSYVEHVTAECNSNSGERGVNVKILLSESDGPVGKLADCELHFTEGPLEGLKLVGFAVWEGHAKTGYSVTFPARQYSVNGERRSFVLLRSSLDADAPDRIRSRILEAYAEVGAKGPGGAP